MKMSQTGVVPRITLWAETAADLMTSNPISIGENATVKEAVAFLTDKGYSAAPVIDDAGRPVGVLSRADIVVHDREKVDYLPALTEAQEEADFSESFGERFPSGFHVEDVDRTRVSDIMTPTVFCVSPETSAFKVIRDLLALKVHRLFVVGRDGLLIGVISAFDVLRRLRPE